jgi:hypothetical protein
MSEFIDVHDGQAIGSVRIQQVVCWNTALLLKIATVFPDNQSNQLKESSVEIFVTLTHQNATYSVASDAMRANMQRIIVSGKGPVGHHGRKLYKGGYRAVIDSVQRVVDNFNNVNMQVSFIVQYFRPMVPLYLTSSLFRIRSSARTALHMETLVKPVPGVTKRY